MTTPTLDTTPAIRIGTLWTQRVRDREGKILTRVIEVITRPSLSVPVGYRIVRNDAHPHRVGKTGTIRVSDLRRKYEAVAA